MLSVLEELFSNRYFPNVTELTIKDYARTYCGSMLTALNEMIPLKQLNKLTIDCNDFPINKLVNLLSLTPNLRTLKWNFQSVDHPQVKLIQQNLSKTYSQKLNILIKAENLLDDYFIKFVDRDLYLW
ncbi:unnamed protein product, partial [Rotaria magnacalcarata]